MACGSFCRKHSPVHPRGRASPMSWESNLTSWFAPADPGRRQVIGELRLAWAGGGRQGTLQEHPAYPGDEQEGLRESVPSLL